MKQTVNFMCVYVHIQFLKNYNHPVTSPPLSNLFGAWLRVTGSNQGAVQLAFFVPGPWAVSILPDIFQLQREPKHNQGLITQ